MSKLLNASTGLEWAIYMLGPPLLVYGLFTGHALLLGSRGAVQADVASRPAWYWGLMAFHALCSIGLAVSLRTRARRKGRWFPDR